MGDNKTELDKSGVKNDYESKIDTAIGVIVENVLPANCFGPNPFIENITKTLQKYFSSFEVIFKFHLLLYILEFCFDEKPTNSTQSVLNTQVQPNNTSQITNAESKVDEKPKIAVNNRPKNGASLAEHLRPHILGINPQNGGTPEGDPEDADDTAIVVSSKKCYITGRVQRELHKYNTPSSMSKKQIISDINYIIHSHIDRISKQLLTESELKKTLDNVKFTTSNLLIKNIITNQRYRPDKEDTQILLVRILARTKQFFKSLAKSIAYFLIIRPGIEPVKDDQKKSTAECLSFLMEDSKIRKIIIAIAKEETSENARQKNSVTKNKNAILGVSANKPDNGTLLGTNQAFYTLYNALKKTRILSVKSVNVMPRFLRNIYKLFTSKNGGGGDTILSSKKSKSQTPVVAGTPKRSPLLTDPRSPAYRYMNDILINATNKIVKQINKNVNDKMQDGIINKIFEKLGPVDTNGSTSQDYLNTYSDEKHAMNVSLILCVLKTLDKSFIDFLRKTLKSNTSISNLIIDTRTQPEDNTSIQNEDRNVVALIYDIIIQQTEKELNTPKNIKELTKRVEFQYLSFIPSISPPSTSNTEDESHKTFFTNDSPIQKAFFEAINMFAPPPTGGRPNRSDSRKTRKNIKRNAKRPMRGTRKDRSEEIP